MEAFGILGFIFGVVAFVRVEKLTKTLKEKKHPGRGLQGRVGRCPDPLSKGKTGASSDLHQDRNSRRPLCNR